MDLPTDVVRTILQLSKNTNRRVVSKEFQNDLHNVIIRNQDYVSFIKFLKKCRNLQSITVCESRLTDQLLNNMILHTSTLQEIDIRNCLHLTSIEPLGKCINIKSIKLILCTFLESIEPLKNCTQLEVLYLTYSESLTSIDALRKCVNLKKLYISVCKRITTID